MSPGFVRRAATLVIECAAVLDLDHRPLACRGEDLGRGKVQTSVGKLEAR